MAISDPKTMSSPLNKQHETEVVADRVLKRVKISRMIRRLQNRLALAQFKTKHGLEDLTLDSIEPRFQKELRRSRLPDGDILSDSSSSASNLLYPTRGLKRMTTPKGGNPFPNTPSLGFDFSNFVYMTPSPAQNYKRSYPASFEYDQNISSPSKRFRQSPTAHRSLTYGSHSSWKDDYNSAQLLPMEFQLQQHFTTLTGPNVTLFNTSYLVASPSPARPTKRRFDNNNHITDNNHLLMEPPSTPPPKHLGLLSSNKLALPSSIMTTPKGGNPFPNTPGLGFDFSDFVHMTPSPAQKPWKTPIAKTQRGDEIYEIDGGEFRESLR